MSPGGRARVLRNARPVHTPPGNQQSRGIVADINRAGVRAGPRQGNSRKPIMWPIVRSTPDARPGQPQTKKRKCGIQPAHQSLFTDVFASRSLLCTIHRVTQLHASTREEALSCALCLTWDIRMGWPVRAQRPKANLWPWIEQACKRLAHRNLLAIALANKLARIAWAVLARGRDYQPRITPNAA